MIGYAVRMDPRPPPLILPLHLLGIGLPILDTR